MTYTKEQVLEMIAAIINDETNPEADAFYHLCEIKHNAGNTAVLNTTEGQSFLITIKDVAK